MTNARGLERIYTTTLQDEQAQDASDAAIRAIQAQLDALPKLKITRVTFKFAAGENSIEVPFGFVPTTVQLVRAKAFGGADVVVHSMVVWSKTRTGAKVSGIRDSAGDLIVSGTYVLDFLGTTAVDSR